tara:strand:+ start:4688 stop:4912 length:225 start_codon:yes stop_codon:yes gene_type:complete
MANKTKRLHELQDILIEEFILRIQTGEASPSDLNAARQLLKDNGIHAQLKPDNPLANLIAGLPFDDESDRVVER